MQRQGQTPRRWQRHGRGRPYRRPANPPTGRPAEHLRATLVRVLAARPPAKRVLDLTLGSALLVLATPALAAGALVLAARRPPGGVLNRSPRLGPGGRVFVLRSLRTRRLRLDLLSRLPYVVRGDLSLVGPEPLAPDDDRARPPGSGPRGSAAPPAAAPVPAGHWLQELKPGLTGLAQVRSRSGMPWDEPALLDQHYAEHHRVGLDLVILAEAVRIPLHRALRRVTRPGKAHLSDTDHRRCGYSAAE